MLKVAIAKIVEMFESILSPEGKLSFGRFATLILVVAVVTWDSAYVFMSWKFNLIHPEFHIPMTEMLPSVATLTGQIIFMTAFYVTTKVQEATIKADDNATKVAVATADAPKES